MHQNHPSFKVFSICLTLVFAVFAFVIPHQLEASDTKEKVVVKQEVKKTKVKKSKKKEAEQAAEVVRAAANSDINTIFGAVINENLNDERIYYTIDDDTNENIIEKENKDIFCKNLSKGYDGKKNCDICFAFWDGESQGT